jgi:hypothetical protein
MKHPVDTSQWGEFVVGELFETNGNKTYTGAGIPKNNLEAGSTPRITVTDKNNGIIGYFNDTDNANYRVYENFISVSFLGTVFWHPYKASVDMKVHVLNKPKSTELNEERALFLVACIKKTIATISYAEQLSASKLYDLTIKLPLKPSADPTNYSQADIDWDYMETVMSHVTARAKDRLANLPQPTDKKKTPVDTSSWGEFVVGELFDKCDLKRIKPDFNKYSDLSSTPSEEFNLPLINAKVGNNGIMYYGRSSDWEAETMTLDIVNDGAASTGMVYAQPQATGTLYNAYQIKLKPSVHQNLTVSQLLFLATTTQASIQNKFSYENKAIWNKVKAETIKLPLKPSANPSNYTQEDIDWDYMENFMKTIEEKAHNRLKTLQKTIA